MPGSQKVLRVTAPIGLEAVRVNRSEARIDHWRSVETQFQQ